MANLVPEHNEPMYTPKNSIKQRNSLLRKYKLTGNPETLLHFKYTRNKITSELRKAKRAFLINKLHHADSKTFWKLYKTLNRKETNMPSLRCPLSGTVTNSRAKANILNEQFFKTSTTILAIYQETACLKLSNLPAWWLSLLRGKTSPTFLYAGSEKINWSGRYLSPNAKKYSTLYNPQPLQTFQSLYQNWQGSQRLHGSSPVWSQSQSLVTEKIRPTLISILPVISKILERHM